MIFTSFVYITTTTTKLYEELLYRIVFDKVIQLGCLWLGLDMGIKPWLFKKKCWLAKVMLSILLLKKNMVKK